ncbi:zinc finger protein [Colletotrichum chrysophilum]|uniref:Zinc finger protein n=1 Tax=Colletotrichum chrysophilum TaxID=1836956 RepID=A0AAD9ASR5_9PEZI|nr:zinc finger protein [Colletotrichum chrysophilum]
MASNSQLKDGYERAANNFKDSIPADLAKRFAKQTNDIASLRKEIKTIQDDHGKKGSLRNLPRLQKFVEAMNQLGQVIEVFVNANDLVCFIWIAKTHLDNFDKLLDVFAQMGDVMPGLLFYRDMFIQHEPLRVVLQDYYSDILKFHEAAIKVFAQWKDIFHATWKTFNTQFDPIMKSLVHRGELLESVKLSASLDQIQIIRRQISDMYQDQIRTANEETREKHLSRMALIKDKLRAPEYFLDQEIATQRRNGDDTEHSWVTY